MPTNTSVSARAAALGALSIVVLSVAGGAADGITLSIKAGKESAPAGPACFKPSAPVDPKSTCLMAGEGSAFVPAQVDDHGRVWWWRGPMKAGQVLDLRLVPADGSPAEGGPGLPIQVKPGGEGVIEVTAGGKPFTAFTFKKNELKPYLFRSSGPRAIR